MKFANVDVQYLQDYIALCERAAAAGPGVLCDRVDDETDEEVDAPGYVMLEELNEKAKSDGVNPRLIKKEFVGWQALKMEGAWYSSSLSCMVAGEYPDIE